MKVGTFLATCKLEQNEIDQVCRTAKVDKAADVEKLPPTKLKDIADTLFKLGHAWKDFVDGTKLKDAYEPLGTLPKAQEALVERFRDRVTGAGVKTFDKDELQKLALSEDDALTRAARAFEDPGSPREMGRRVAPFFAGKDKIDERGFEAMTTAVVDAVGVKGVKGDKDIDALMVKHFGEIDDKELGKKKAQSGGDLGNDFYVNHFYGRKGHTNYGGTGGKARHEKGDENAMTNAMGRAADALLKFIKDATGEDIGVSQARHYVDNGKHPLAVLEMLGKEKQDS